MHTLKASRPETRREAQSGFTLLELSIVLVVIGLIIGGVLKGQELIGSAQINAVQTDMQNIETAANMFYATNNEPITADTDNTGACEAGGFWDDIDSVDAISGIDLDQDPCGPENPLSNQRYGFENEPGADGDTVQNALVLRGETLNGQQAENLDNKLDDGNPETGALRNIGGDGCNGGGDPATWDVDNAGCNVAYDLGNL